MNSFRFLSKTVLATFILACTFSTQASIMDYDITISGGWNEGGSSFGMGLSPHLSGSLVVDSSQEDANALVDFSLQTGSYLWTKSDIDTSGRFSLSFVGDDLVNFTFGTLSGTTGGYGWLYSSNTFYVNDGSESNFCNRCVSFSPADVVEPSSAVLLGLGLAMLGIARRKTTKSQ